MVITVMEYAIYLQAIRTHKGDELDSHSGELKTFPPFTTKIVSFHWSDPRHRHNLMFISAHLAKMLRCLSLFIIWGLLVLASLVSRWVWLLLFLFLFLKKTTIFFSRHWLGQLDPGAFATFFSCSFTTLLRPTVFMLHIMSAAGRTHGKLSLSILWQLHDNGRELNGHGLLIPHNLPIEAIQVSPEVIVSAARCLFPCYPVWRVTGESMSRWRDVSAIILTTFPSWIITTITTTTH